MIKHLKKYWQLIDESEFILWSPEDRSLEKVDVPNKNLDWLEAQNFSEKIKKY